MSEEQQSMEAVDQREEAQAEEVIDIAAIIEPLMWEVVVLPRKVEEKTKGGIVLPEEAMRAEEYQTSVGEILAVGPFWYQATTRAGIDFSKHPNPPKVGDFVLFARYAGQRVNLSNGQHLLIMSDTDLLARTRYPDLLKYYI